MVAVTPPVGRELLTVGTLCCGRGPAGNGQLVLQSRVCLELHLIQESELELLLRTGGRDQRGETTETQV